MGGIEADPRLAGVRYLGGALALRDLPADEGAEVAFAGRSNAGKSSAINALAAVRGLARTSKTPGRTQILHFFAVGDPGRRLVDLPGYGFARAPLALRRRWEAAIGAYLQRRRSLRGLVLLSDVRHPLRESDRLLLGWCAEAGLAVHVALTKADKLRRGPAAAALARVRRELADAASVQLLSVVDGTGVGELRDVVAAWLELGTRAKKDPGQKGGKTPGSQDRPAGETGRTTRQGRDSG
ncbi:ribosome biogenesis GTP-binding protein YihA/YsxC [Inmirania thermothiophila]|uniref:Probable GTP-binding protein EngB n=1 Tax=Inmirania thermothiophila TaxID=1750597 RepID=A0A3N1Y6X8_9GAMM|nr:ribosome biogenesis GTP-binding protein YihA/YsxC [Inmirania thermothiophila]ROR34281.1 cell division checkpoint GTPase YihA [Inmirania thermothiophila]